MHILGHGARTTLVWTIAIHHTLSSIILSPLPSLPLSYTLFHPLRWSLPWDRRAGRTWSTRAKLSAKLRKIVSDTSSYPPLWFYPSSRPRCYLRTGQQWYGQAGRRLESKRKTTDGKRKRAGNVQYPVRSSLIYGRRGDLAPRLRYNTYVTDMREIPRS